LGSSSAIDENTQQLHRPLDLVAQDRDRAIDAFTPAGHQSVEVGTPDERELRAECDRGHDVGTVHDARVDHHRGVLADLAHDGRSR
jgi:hypothetical protein